MLHPSGAVGFSEINIVEAAHEELYSPISTFFADEAREGGSFRLSLKSQDLKNWQGKNSDIIYQQNDEGCVEISEK